MLTAGTRLGPYEIVSPLGAGGMGEVYRARDPRLNRTVAIKVLPEDFVADPERRQRFEREARVIASLSHPHICALHDVGTESSRAYLVMEFLEGETLAERLARGALPLAETIRHGRDIAMALHAAHRQHIVHRDLKPGNIMLTRSGLKLLDFGLAKAADPLFQGADGLSTRALTNVTTPGVIMGTIPYMAPEQIEGRPADWRSDIFALGAVLYEMATGRRAFTGASSAAVASAILTSDPPRITVSSGLDRIVRTCLEKDPERRWQSAHDVALQLSGLMDLDGRPESVTARTSAWLPWAIAAAAVAVAATALLWRGRDTRGSSQASTAGVHGPVSFPIAPPPGGAFFQFVEAPTIAVSPDGQHVAYVARAAGARQGAQQLWIRSLASLHSRPLEGTDGATSMFWSPDGRALAFFARGKLRKIDVTGGGIVTIADARQDVGQTGTWGTNDRILFATVEGDAIRSVETSGGTIEEVRKPDPARKETRLTWPLFLPDGRQYLYLAHFPDATAAVMLARPGGTPREVLRVKTSVQYVDPGYLLFAQDGTLVARRFNVETGALTGDPIAIDSSINYSGATGLVPISASRKGVLAYQSHRDLSRIAAFDATGRELETVRPQGGFQTVRVSADGRQLLFEQIDPRTATWDLWSLDLERGAESRLTSEPGAESFPIWAPGGTVIYGATRGASPRLFRRTLATGTDEALSPAGMGLQRPHTISPDGEFLLYSQRAQRGNFDLIVRRFSDGQPAPFRDSAADEFDARFAPGGRLVAYVSDESGRNEVHVAPFPSRGSGIPVSTGGGVMPRWRADGSQLFYLAENGDVMAVPVRTAPTLAVGKPVRLFSQAPGARWAEFDVAPDGRFFAVVRIQSSAQQPLTVIVNWPASLSR